MRERTQRVKAMRCIACELEGRLDVCGITEEHHLLVGGNAGQRRRGDDFTIPLGQWHHQAIPKRGWVTKQMRDVYGPSLARESKAFRRHYGKDDALLAIIDKRLGVTA